MIALLMVASVAGCNKIFPCVATASASGDHMIDGKVFSFIAILAPMTITLEHIPSRNN
jgi:hypothetical protein